jgi:predicted nucleic acid-binding protein
MKAIFVDTAGWMSCADEADPNHRRSAVARDAWLETGGIFVTTDYVIDETLTLIRMRLGIKAAKGWYEQIEASNRLQWEWVGVERAEKARALFFEFQDKDFSFTDCTSFVIMKEFRLKQVLTADKHFEQMGFQTLPPRKRV